MGKDAFRDFFGFAASGLANGFDDVRRNFFQRLNVEIPANILDDAIITVRYFHKQQPIDCNCWVGALKDKITVHRLAALIDSFDAFGTFAAWQNRL